MNNRIDIQEFKSISRFTFIEGAIKKAQRTLEGKTLEFYNLDKEVLEKLSKEKGLSEEDNITFLYKIIPLISNIDMTLNVDEFKKMCKVPSLQFANYIDMLMEHIKEMYTTANTLNSMENKIKDFAVENNIELPVEKEKTKEEKLDELYDELHSCKDRNKSKEIIEEINRLEVDDVIG